jgi:endonuclease/exonuclease/phosphatase (EEP) superfamily protein YafD
MPETNSSTAGHKIRRMLRSLARAFASGSGILIAGGLIGQALRDRSVAAALLMYVPLPLVGAAALVLDIARKGRSIPRFRFGLSALGIAAFAWSAHAMTGSGLLDEPRPGDREVSILHWNVQWGGGLFRSPATWEAQCGAILAKEPDLIVLSEVPPGDWIHRLVADLGPGANFVGIHHDPTSPYWYRLAVCSRWPLRLERRLPLPGGTGMSVVADVEGRRIRMMVVDGISSPIRPRLPFLRAIAGACQEAEAAGQPFDLVLGDFNTPSRSLGFNDLAALGYRLAGRSARGWRATFPAWLPVYDIDHIWLRAGLRIGSCTFFNGPYTDHRGQVVRVLLPEEPRE